MIFCIGIHKTGLTSLSRALNVLGLKGWQFPHPANVHLWLSGRVQLDFGCDLPFMLDYPRFDRLFPGSKFIVTERENTDEWLASCAAQRRKHLAIPHREAYITAMYGTYAVERQNHLAVRARHYAAIEDYFKSRPEDVLYMNIVEKGDGWEKLCPFLGREIPDLPFPHRNKRIAG